MINGYMGSILETLKETLMQGKTIDVWMSYFYIKFSTINIEPCYVQLSMNNNDITITKINTGEIINLSQIDIDHIYLSENENDVTSIYNENIYYNIIGLEKKIKDLQAEFNKFSGEIQYAENCFINTDITMEKLTRE